jgi:hypothetical protein
MGKTVKKTLNFATFSAFSVLYLFLLVFLEISRQIRMFLTIGEIFPTPPLSLYSGGGKLAKELTMR